MATVLEEFGVLDYSTPFILVNVMTMITLVPGNLLPLQMMKGQRASSDGVAAFCQAHIFNWGVCCGVSNGDQYDCFQVMLILALKLAGWAPYRLVQLYVAMASIYWALNCVTVNLSTIVGTPRFAQSSVPPIVAGFFVFMSNFELFTVLWRALQFVPEGSAVILISWFWISIVLMMHHSFRIAWLVGNPFWVFMQEVAALRLAHVDKGNKWSPGADDPVDFDLVRASASALDHMKQVSEIHDIEIPEDLTSVSEINQAIESFIEEETVPMKVWLPASLLVVAALLLSPIFLL